MPDITAVGFMPASFGATNRFEYRLVRLDNEAVDRLIPETEDDDDDE